MNINKKEFIDIMMNYVVQMDLKNQYTKKEAEYFYEAFLKTLTESLVKEQRIFFSGFGSFFVKERAPTVKTNPQNPNIRFNIPSKKVVRFKPSDKLNDTVN